jgi:DNA-binding transcriptional MerR regulator
VADDPRFGIEELATLGGVSRRTVRYYVQEGLLPAPLGVGRGDHYGRVHVDQLLKVRALQEAGRTLDEIRHALNHRSRGAAAAAADRAVAPSPERSVWRRLTLAPGVELNVAGDVRLPPPGKLAELAAWCRTHFPSSREEDHDA